jgi:uncharacterized FlgJ-related protein
MISDIINEITSIEHEACMEYLKKYPNETSEYRNRLDKMFQQYDKYAKDLYDITKSESD